MIFGQKGKRQQLSHLGERAEQHTLPWSTSLWQKSVCSAGGIIFKRSNSTLVGSVFSVRPRRLEILPAWVSTTIPGTLNMSPKTKLAVFLPTPGRVRRSFILSGTLPLKSEMIFWTQAIIFFALFL